MLNKNQRLYSPMKPKSKTPRLFLAAAIVPLVLSANITAQTIRTWDAGGNTTVLTEALNWSGDAFPASTGANATASRQDASWNGSPAGPLNLTFGSAFGGSFGVGLVMTANQTDSLTLTNSAVGAQTLRLINSTSTTVGGIQLASGAGAFTIGAAGAANPISLTLGSGAAGVNYNYYFANNSANTATIEENVTITKGGSHNAALIFNAGNWNVKGVVGALSATAGGGSLNVNAGSVTLSANNTGDGVVNVNGGRLKFNAANNLGTGTSAVRLGQTTSSGVLEFTGSSDATISRLMRIGNGATATNQTGSGTITNNGTGVLTFDNTTFNEVGATTATGAARTLTLNGANTGANTILGVIANNNPGLVSVIKEGDGKWVLSGNNTFTGGVLAKDGTLALGHDNALGTGLLTLGSGSLTATIQSADATKRTIANAVTMALSTTFSGPGDLLFTGAVNGGGGQKVITVTGITTEFQNTISGAGDRVKAGTGTLRLSGNNSGQAFNLYVNQGTLDFTTANALGSASTAIRVGQTSANAVLKFTGASDANLDRQIRIGNGNSTGDTGGSTIQNDGAGSLAFGNATFNQAGNAVEARSLTLRGTNTGNNLISGAIVDNIGANATVNLVKNDSGTWNLTGENTFSGGLQIWDGVLEFDGNGSLGAQTIQTRTGRLSTSGTLRHTGADDTIVTGQMQVGFGAGGTGNATIESTGVGTLSFNNATFNNAEGAANAHRTLTLGGNNTGANTISGAIVNNNNTNARIAITKTGTGTWVLGGNNTYTGNTTVSDGSLVLANSGRLRFNIGATGVNNTLNGTGNVTLNGGFIFNLGSAGTTTGNSWNIVNVATLIEGYGGSFSVSSLVGPFTNSSGTWTRSENGVTYRFVQSTGVLSVIPAGANYSTWASAFSGPALSNTASTADPDNDGLINAIEYALGFDPRFSSPSPGVISNGGKTITFTKGAEAKVNGDVTYGIEVSTTLGVAPSPWTLGTSPEVTQTADTIAITFPAGPVKNFARLKVILAP